MKEQMQLALPSTTCTEFLLNSGICSTTISSELNTSTISTSGQWQITCTNRVEDEKIRKEVYVANYVGCVERSFGISYEENAVTLFAQQVSIVDISSNSLKVLLETSESVSKQLIFEIISLKVLGSFVYLAVKNSKGVVLGAVLPN